MSTTCASKRYAPTTPAPKYPPTKEDGTKSWVVADVPCNEDGSTKNEDADELRQKVNALKCKFHRERELLVKHLPRNVKEHEIAELLFDFKIKKIQLANNDDTSAGTATVTLLNPEVLDEWDRDRQFLLREQSVIVEPTPTEMLLCIARLPFRFTEADFYDLIKEYGEVKMHFLMVSERTGISKGYGFVQYASKENALMAKSALNDKVIDAFQLICDWLDSSHLTFSSLHSTCLYVDNLPQQFRDMGEFRAVFERVVKPPYCQIALKKGCPLDWGLVEYLSPIDAELAQMSCHNYRLRNQAMRVVYCIPGVRAINLMLKMLDTTPRVKSAGLLPDPSGHSIRMSIENLSKQNPIFAENLKNIIMHQIQESKQGKENGYEDDKRNGAGKNAEPKTVDGVAPKLNHDIEKIVPPTPPMTPTIINGVPIISSTVPILPNTAVPPPAVVDKMAYNQQLSLSLKDKYPLVWDGGLLGPSLSNGVYPAHHPSIVSGTVSPEAGTPTFAISPPQLPPSLMHDVLNLPLSVQQNIFTLISNPAGLTAQAAMPPTAATLPPPPPPSVQYPSLTIDPLRLFQNPPPETLVSPQPQLQPQQLLTVPTIVSKGVLPTTWASISPFMTPTSVPIFTTAAAATAAAEQWQNLRMTNVMSSQPTTPIGHHFTTGQKRKLLPSPEKSPEGNYIGQHSQGIGGHYADSYFKKKKMF